MKILFVENAYPINTRTERMVGSLKETFGDDSVKVACWNRNNHPVIQEKKDYFIFNRNAAYASKIAKLRGMRGMYRFVKNICLSLLPDVIIASHWDALLLCAKAKNANAKLVYENLDMPTGSMPVRKILSIAERLALRKTDCITFASRFYLPYYERFNGHKIVIENKLPHQMCEHITPKKSDTDVLTITFLGGIRYVEIMENLIKAIGNNPHFKFNIYGGNVSYPEFNDVVAQYNNVEMFGPYDYCTVPKIYAASDVIWAAYPSDDFNVKLAISNKYHESICYGVPAIYSKNTKLGQMVAASGCGYTVDCYSVDDIQEIMQQIHADLASTPDKIKISMKKQRAGENFCWEEEVKPLIDYLKEI